MNPRQPLPPDDDPLLDPANARLAARARAELEDSARALDSASLSRLNRARQQALDAARSPRRAGWRWPALALASSGCALVAVLALWRMPAPESERPAQPPLATDLALIGDGSDLELVEDLEFYAWLDAQSADG